ncbi:Glucitol operon repressor [subsurface metagenome]
MLQEKRQAEILNIIRERNFVDNCDLQKLFKVTSITIRRDLKVLSQQKLIKKVHGGALSIDDPITTIEPLYKTKSYINIKKKEAIGNAAIKFIENGDTIIFDTGTTTYQIAKRLKNNKFENINIITNDIKIAYDLGNFGNLRIFVIGGELKNFLYSLSGTMCVNFLDNLKADKIFLSADAINLECISNSSIEDVPIKQKMIESSKEVILVADSSKYDKQAFCKVCMWDQIDFVISNNETPKKYVDLFIKRKINYKFTDILEGEI